MFRHMEFWDWVWLTAVVALGLLAGVLRWI